MTKNQTIEFDNEMKALAQGIYKGNEKLIPKDWIKVSEFDKKSGFHGEAFYKDGKVVIAMRGTDEFERLENFINQQVAAGKVMPEALARQQVQVGNLIYVKPYTRSDGTQVKGYYRSR